jgi:hypothetical protein
VRPEKQKKPKLESQRQKSEDDTSDQNSVGGIHCSMGVFKGENSGENSNKHFI